MNLDDLGQPLDASDVEGDPHDRPVVRDGGITSAGGWCAPKEVVEQAAAAEARLTEQLREQTGRDDISVAFDTRPVRDEPDDGPDRALGEVVDAARVAMILRDARDPARPLPPADVLFAAMQYDRAIGDPVAVAAAARMLDHVLAGKKLETFDLGVEPGLIDLKNEMDPAELRKLAEGFREAAGKPGTWVVPPPLPAAPADAAFVLYLAGCTQCAQSGTNLGDGDPRHMAVPFASESDRDKWAQTHANVRRHRVALVEQNPSTGSTITGYAEQAPGDDTPVRAAVPYEPPLIAFVVRSGQQPDLICTIPERAAAAWLLTAAHATLLGRGSLGIPQPHRALYVGRITRKPAPGDKVPEVSIRIDGLLGGTDDRFGRPIGSNMHVAAKLTPDQVEDVCEALISRTHGLPRNLFSVVVMADAPTAEPPDELAEATLRAERLVRSDQHTGTKVDALAEFVDRGPAAEVAETAPDR